MFFIFQKRIMNTAEGALKDERVSSRRAPASAAPERRGHHPAGADAGLVRDHRDLGAAAIHGIYHGDVRHVRESELACDGRMPEWISVSADGPSRVVFGGLLRALDDPSPDPKVRLLRERVVADGAVGETLTIASRVTDPIETTLSMRLVPDFAPLQEVKAGIATARAWDATGAVGVNAPSP